MASFESSRWTNRRNVARRLACGGGSTVCYFYDDEIGTFDYGANHPMKPVRLRMVDDLVRAYQLHSKMDVLIPGEPTDEEFTQFHAKEYVKFLKNISTSQRDDHLKKFNFGEDCPAFHGLWEYCKMSAGGSIESARKLMRDGYEVAINWAGGQHHGKRHEASGFCYVNDCVLAALEMLKYKHRVLYIDIDVHHGDGVEEAFYSTPRVLSVSFHKYGNYFPGTGYFTDIGVGEGQGYAINVPLFEGLDDDTFKHIFKQIMTLVMQQYKPEAIILQSGADSLAGDKLGCFNLSLEGHGYACEFLKAFRIPMLVLGGGGYTVRNVAKCWANETGILLSQRLEKDIPRDSDFYSMYAIDPKLTVRPLNMQNKNTTKSLDLTIQHVTEIFREHVFPGGATLSANDIPEYAPTTAVKLCEIPVSDDVSTDHGWS